MGILDCEVTPKWVTPQIVDDYQSTGWYPNFQVVDGKPAIAYRHAYYGNLAYVRAQDADGTSWEAPVAVNVGEYGYATSLKVVNGTPAITYWSGFSN